MFLMIQLNRILLPTDFSECSSEATAYAFAMAERFDAELHLLHVLETHLSAPQFGMGLAVPGLVEESEDKALKALAKLPSAAWNEDRNVVLATAKGPPFLEIIRYAKDKEIGMIVMGTHGRSGLAHALIGSVAERVVRKASCPVLTVRHEGHEFVMP
jgi:nucleotide-binding universal stress UspA family protein